MAEHVGPGLPRMALNCLRWGSGLKDDGDALLWASGQPDRKLLTITGLGRASLRWIRQQPLPLPSTERPCPVCGGSITRQGGAYAATNAGSGSGGAPEGD